MKTTFIKLKSISLQTILLIKAKPKLLLFYTIPVLLFCISIHTNYIFASIGLIFLCGASLSLSHYVRQHINQKITNVHESIAVGLSNTLWFAFHNFIVGLIWFVIMLLTLLFIVLFYSLFKQLILVNLFQMPFFVELMFLIIHIGIVFIFPYLDNYETDEDHRVPPLQMIKKMRVGLVFLFIIEAIGIFIFLSSLAIPFYFIEPDSIIKILFFIIVSLIGGAIFTFIETFWSVSAAYYYEESKQQCLVEMGLPMESSLLEYAEEVVLNLEDKELATVDTNSLEAVDDGGVIYKVDGLKFGRDTQV